MNEEEFMKLVHERYKLVKKIDRNRATEADEARDEELIQLLGTSGWTLDDNGKPVRAQVVA